MLLDRLNGKNQSWGVLFLWHTFTKGKLTLYPRHTLAINSGMDGSGYHSSAPVSGFNSRNMTFESVLNFNNIQWAMDIDVDVNAYQKVKQHLATLTTPNRFEKIARRISNLFHVLKKRSKI
jgi:hypothetical protein